MKFRHSAAAADLPSQSSKPGLGGRAVFRIEGNLDQARDRRDQFLVQRHPRVGPAKGFVKVTSTVDNGRGLEHDRLEMIARGLIDGRLENGNAQALGGLVGENIRWNVGRIRHHRQPFGDKRDRHAYRSLWETTKRESKRVHCFACVSETK